MNGLSFPRLMAVAAIIALGVSVTIAALTPLIGIAAVLKLVIPATSVSYLIYLLRHCQEHSGRVVVLTCWSTFAVLAWMVNLSLSQYLLSHLTVIWLIRSLYFYAGILPALADLVLTGGGLLAFVIAAERTGSLLIATWSLFLVQALFVLIPQSVPAAGVQKTVGNSNERFRRARARAEQALRQLIAADQLAK